MPRRRRLFVPGGTYHVIQRGVNRRSIFVANAERERFLSFLSELPGRFGHRIQAYCLMDNHVHLAVQSGCQPLGNALRSLFGRYAQWFNRRHRRSGHLFQSRHKAILVQSDGYVVELVRYIHLNPVRAGIVTRPERYRWSSHRSYIDGDPPDWLETRVALGVFSSRLATARNRFAQFVEEGIRRRTMLDFSRGNVKHQDALAPDGYLTEINAEGERRLLFAKTVELEAAEARLSLAMQLPPEDLCARNRCERATAVRDAMAYLARWGADWRICDLARRYRRTEAALSQGATRFAHRLETSGELRTLIWAIQRGEME